MVGQGLICICAYLALIPFLQKIFYFIYIKRLSNFSISSVCQKKIERKKRSGRFYYFRKVNISLENQLDISTMEILRRIDIGNI